MYTITLRDLYMPFIWILWTLKPSHRGSPKRRASLLTSSRWVSQFLHGKYLEAKWPLFWWDEKPCFGRHEPQGFSRNVLSPLGYLNIRETSENSWKVSDLLLSLKFQRVPLMIPNSSCILMPVPVLEELPAKCLQISQQERFMHGFGTFGRTANNQQESIRVQWTGASSHSHDETR